MSAVKALALSALVVAAATPPAKAGALDRADLSWVSWTPSGVIQIPATASVAPATTASLFGAGSSPYASMTPPPSQPAPVAPAPTPAAWAPIATAAAPTAIAAPAALAAPSAPASGTYDAFINLGNGPYPDAGNLTTGGAQSWTSSQTVAHLFGGQITPQEQASVTNAVVQRVEQTFSQSGVPITVTADPNAPAAHTLSVVSGTTSAWGPVLGLTNIGGNGFDFIDQAAKVSQSVDQLEWVVAHNISHELMLAFGVPENYDQTGAYIDARDANLAMMLNPKATFSQSAAQALLAQNFLSSNGAARLGAQLIGAQTTVPEPATLLGWSAVLGGLVVARRRARAVR
jgi:hypothetical protein